MGKLATDEGVVERTGVEPAEVSEARVDPRLKVPLNMEPLPLSTLGEMDMPRPAKSKVPRPGNPDKPDDVEEDGEDEPLNPRPSNNALPLGAPESLPLSVSFDVLVIEVSAEELRP